jgi:hypothetical protein
MCPESTVHFRMPEDNFANRETAAMSHSLPYEVNCSIAFTELLLLERLAVARAVGLDAIELW